MHAGWYAAGAAGVWLVVREVAHGALPLEHGPVAAGFAHMLCITVLGAWGVHRTGVHRRTFGVWESFRRAVRPALLYVVWGTVAAAAWTFVFRSEVRERVEAEKEAAVRATFATEASFRTWCAATGAPAGLDRETVLNQQLEGMRALAHPGLFVGMHLLALAWAAALVVGCLTAVWWFVLGG